MQVHQKPRIDTAVLLTFLRQQWDRPVVALEPLAEGEDSQVLQIITDTSKYVLRLNRSDYGFTKDAYAYEHFAPAGIPIPKIVQAGRLDDEYAYCISEFVPGKMIEDLDRASVEALLPETLKMLKAIRAVDISATSGYGEIDLSGNGKSTSWQEWLLTHISAPDFDWDDAAQKGRIELGFLQSVFAAFKQLVAQVPNERALVHGDFSSNNVLARGNTIVAVLDWDSACYGDWLFDVAGTYYWRDHLPCLEMQAQYYEQQLSNLPNYRARILCYQLRAALIEMHVQAQRGEIETLQQHIKRCQALLKQLP